MLISVHALATVMRTFIVNVFTNEVHAACGIEQWQPSGYWQPPRRSGSMPCCHTKFALLGAVRGVMHCGQCFGRSLCRPPPTWRPGQGLGRAPELLLECRDDALVALRDACERRCPAAASAARHCMLRVSPCHSSACLAFWVVVDLRELGEHRHRGRHGCWIATVHRVLSWPPSSWTPKRGGVAAFCSTHGVCRPCCHHRPCSCQPAHPSAQPALPVTIAGLQRPSRTPCSGAPQQQRPAARQV